MQKQQVNAYLNHLLIELILHFSPEYSVLISVEACWEVAEQMTEARKISDQLLQANIMPSEKGAKMRGDKCYSNTQFRKLFNLKGV